MSQKLSIQSNEGNYPQTVNVPQNYTLAKQSTAMAVFGFISFDAYIISWISHSVNCYRFVRKTAAKMCGSNLN